MILRMNGVSIRNHVQFCQHFSPLDFLAQKEQAAGFAVEALAPLSPAAAFHAAMLYGAVFQPLSPELSRYSDYGRPANRLLLMQLWDLLLGDNPPDDVHLRLFVSLAAGYHLAGRTLEDTPLTREAAEQCLSQAASPVQTLPFPTIPPVGDLLLPARKEPYRLTLNPEKGQTLLQQGSLLTPRKLLAGRHWQGGTLPVTLQVEDGSANHTIQLQPGQALYCNFVEDTPVYLHPAYPQGDQEILSCLTEPDGGQLLLEANGRLDYRRYSRRDAQIARLRWARHVVQIGWAGGRLLLLDQYGVITSADPAEPPYEGRFSRLPMEGVHEP